MTVQLTERDLERLQWVPDDHNGWTCDLGIVELRVENDPFGYSWTVDWDGDYESGDCESFEDGKRQAVACAARLGMRLTALARELGRRTP